MIKLPLWEYFSIVYGFAFFGAGCVLFFQWLDRVAKRRNKR